MGDTQESGFGIGFLTKSKIKGVPKGRDIGGFIGVRTRRGAASRGVARRGAARRGVARSTLELASLRAGEASLLTYSAGGGKVKKPRTRLDVLGSTMVDFRSIVFSRTCVVFVQEFIFLSVKLRFGF